MTAAAAATSSFFLASKRAELFLVRHDARGVEEVLHQRREDETHDHARGRAHQLKHILHARMHVMCDAHVHLFFCNICESAYQHTHTRIYIGIHKLRREYLGPSHFPPSLTPSHRSNTYIITTNLP